MRLLRRTAEQARDGGKKGVALLMALIMVVLMTAYISEFNYSARARILSAAHARDDMRALYLARSGIRVYMLLLSFGNQIAGNQFVQGMLAQFGMNLDGATMICKDLPFFDTAMLRFLVGAESMASDEKEEGLMELLGMPGSGDGETTQPSGSEVMAIGMEDTPSLRRGLLDFEGDFKVECSDETAKIDINGLAEPSFFTFTSLQQHPIALMLFGQMSPEEYDPLFEERLKIDRWELIANLKDYIDPDEQRSHTFGGDEGRQYDDFEPRYKPKDKLFDTVQEARMVAGVTDEVFATFGPGWSVHNRSYQVNVNTASPAIIRALVRAMADPIVSDQMIDARMPSLMVERMIIPFTNNKQFTQRIQQPSMGTGNGPPVPGILINPDPTVVERIEKLIRTKSDVFRMTSTGYVADSARTMDVTIRMRRSTPRWLDWRER